MTDIVIRFRCVVCGKLTAGRLPRLPWNKGEIVRGEMSYRYNTDVRFPRKHKDASGKTCPGSFRDAEWVEVPAGKA